MPEQVMKIVEHFQAASAAKQGAKQADDAKAKAEAAKVASARKQADAAAAKTAALVEQQAELVRAKVWYTSGGCGFGYWFKFAEEAIE